MSVLQLQIPKEYTTKLFAVQQIMTNHRIIVAFSGGIDSTLIAFLAKEFGTAVLAVHFESPLTPKQERIQAIEFSKILGFPMEIIPLDPLKNPNILRNPIDRCYYCKKDIIKALETVRQRMGYDLIVDGTNASDLEQTRAGLRAIKESNVQSPFALAKITKEDIQQLSCYFGLPSRNIPSQACLASRFPFGMILNPDILIKVDEAEQFLRKYLADVTIQLRVRVHPLGDDGQIMARIEADSQLWNRLANPEERARITLEFKKMGFVFVTMDCAGFESGSMHKLLPKD